MTYEELCIHYDNGVIIKECPLRQHCEKMGIYNVKGLYKNSKIAIDCTLTNREKKCVLMEEIEHHYTSSGNILDMRDYQSRKQEKIARRSAANKLICFEDFKKYMYMYNEDLHLVADELDVTHEVILTYLETLQTTDQLLANY